MPKKVAAYAQEFAAAHPSAGEHSAGSVMTAEEAISFGETLALRTVELSRRRDSDLTREQKRFISFTADLGTRNIIHLLERGFHLPTEGLPSLQATASELRRHADPKAAPRAENPVSPNAQELIRELTPIAGGLPLSMTERPELRGQFENHAVAACDAFGKIIEANGGQVDLDAYMANNLDVMKTFFEQQRGTAT